MKNNPKLAGNLHKYNFGQADNVWSVDGICPTILAYNQGQIGHQINILEENEDGEIKFLSTHGIVYGKAGDCVSLTFGMSKVHVPHTPIMAGGILMTITTKCDHDIGVIVEYDGKQGEQHGNEQKA